ncbi:transmembrane ascorbate-dependent reductase CYB561-like [Ornithodoros turicata]|uniref:transmembrane ascorbate-dependent reductase CYB561-like n=1 Tax=Ornithodoros turicata TaxID=34597 RepID=UPI003138FC3F
MDRYMGAGSPQDLRGFSIIFGLVQVVGIACVALVAVWTSHFLGGFAGPHKPNLEFNFHPLFMVLALVICYGNATLIYRVLRYERLSRLKCLHGALQGLALVFSVVAVKTAFDSHNLAPTPIPNLYSLHSWLGLGTVVLFVLQFAVGFFIFLFPGMGQLVEENFRPFHVFFGLSTFVMAVATALIGITEKLIFKLKPAGYSARPEEAYLANSLGVLLVVFAALVVYLTTRPAYRRQPLLEEASLPLGPPAQLQAPAQFVPQTLYPLVPQTFGPQTFGPQTFGPQSFGP